MTKQEAAYHLYKNDATHVEIAKVLDLSAKTITNWRRKYNWEEKRRRETVRQTESENLVWNLYLHNLRVLNEMVVDWEASGEKKVVTKGDVDALAKFYIQIKDKALVWKQYVKMIRELLAFIYSEDVNVAKEIEKTGMLDAFLNHKRINA